MDAEIAAFVAAETGRSYVSDWLTVDQPMIDAFADTTMDQMYLHVDPLAAAASEFGGTIAHGFLLLSLLAPMRSGLARAPFPKLRAGLNYGFERIRFVAPVRAGRRLRGRFTVASLAERAADQVLETLDVAVEIKGEERPALVARWLTMYLVAP